MTTLGMRSNGQDYDHHRRFDTSAEDAALEFERAMLQDSPAPNQRKKGGEGKKRPIPGTGSDFDGEMGTMMTVGDAPGPSLKRRKLDNGSPSMANGVDGLYQETMPLKLSISKFKGKGKQIQREQSHDSVSLTPKPRRKPGPKKKIGLGLDLENEQASRPASVVGDVTPSVSRPNSPLPSNTTMIYELDEVMQPMRKAKKVDEMAMLKRIKSLEEAQRKVWTNIARRDVSKVRAHNFYTYQCLSFIQGLQISYTWLSNTPGIPGAHRQTGFDPSPKTIHKIGKGQQRLAGQSETSDA
jgi:DNA helicase INO80